jgi:hypothetical protein
VGLSREILRLVGIWHFRPTVFPNLGFVFTRY